METAYMKNNKYRVIVWGPGFLGCACLRELVRRPEFEVVGVFAYSAAKGGKDIGELIGHAPLGVKVTTDREAIFALDADCVVWTGKIAFNDAEAEEMDRDIIRLLESGKNVVSPATHHYPHFFGAAYAEKFEAACRKGKTCLHGTGENPGFWFERVGLTLTAVCNDVEHIRVDEFLAVPSVSSPEQLNAVGFGQSMEQASKPGPLTDVWKKYFFVQTVSLATQSLFGRAPDRIENKSTYFPVERDVVFETAKGDPIDMVVPAGTVGAIQHTFSGIIDGQPRVISGLNWYLRAEDSPFKVKAEHHWTIEIEGKPTSLRCEFSAFASLKGDQEFYPGDPTSATLYATAAVTIQAIPVVCAHEPGIVYASVFTSATNDLRKLATRKSLV
jgi:4-hydroxy-tetrahydrodipicolinate reductase